MMARVWQIVSRFLLLSVAVLLGFVCDAEFAGKLGPYALPFVIFMCLFLGVYFLLLSNSNLFPSINSLWLFLPPVFFSFTAALNAPKITTDPLSLKYVLSLVFTFLYIALLAMTYRGGRLADFCLFDYLYGFKELVKSLFVQPARFVSQIINDIGQLIEDGTSPIQGGASSDGTSVQYGRSVAVLMFIALFLLFLWADYAFRMLFRPASGNLGQYVAEHGGTIVGTFFWSYLILGLVLHAGTQSLNEYLTAADRERYFRHWLDFGVSIKVFFTVLVMALLYSVTRSYCSLNASQCLGADGFTAWTQPVFGFWGLTIAAVLIFALVLWLDHVTRIDGEIQRLAHTFLNICLFLNEMVIVGMATVSIKVDATMFIHATRHMWYARAGVVWLLLMFAMFIGYEHLERECDFPFAALLVTTGLVGAYTLFGGLLVALGIAVSW